MSEIIPLTILVLADLVLALHNAAAVAVAVL